MIDNPWLESEARLELGQGSLLQANLHSEASLVFEREHVAAMLGSLS